MASYGTGNRMEKALDVYEDNLEGTGRVRATRREPEASLHQVHHADDENPYPKHIEKARRECPSYQRKEGFGRRGDSVIEYADGDRQHERLESDRDYQERGGDLRARRANERTECTLMM